MIKVKKRKILLLPGDKYDPIREVIGWCLVTDNIFGREQD